MVDSVKIRAVIKKKKSTSSLFEHIQIEIHNGNPSPETRYTLNDTDRQEGNYTIAGIYH